MRDKISNYLFILKLELKDLHDDIDVLIEACRKERESCLITNYVFMENLSLFQNEILGVDVFEKIIENTNPHDYGSLDELIEDLKDKFQRKMVEYGIAKAINLSILRKMDKVKRYVTQ
ncbi:MAG: hypothetical protein ACOC2H_10880 [Spirochaetota bacterium]